MNLKQWVTQIKIPPREKLINLALTVLLAGAVFKLLGLNFSADIDDGNWDAFKAEHHCQLQKSEYGVQKASWLCNDGKLYYRWRQQR